MSTALLANVYSLILRITVPILLLASISTAAEAPRRVLFLDSFQKGIGLDVFKAAFISELRAQSPEPLFFYEVSIPERFSEDRDERSFLNYLHSSFAEQQLDLIVTEAGTAARFAQRTGTNSSLQHHYCLPYSMSDSSTTASPTTAPLLRFALIPPR